MVLVEAFRQTSILQEMWISLHQYKGLVDQQVCWLDTKSLLQVVPMDIKVADVSNINIIVHFPCFQLANGFTVLCLQYPSLNNILCDTCDAAGNEHKTYVLHNMMLCSLENRYMLSYITGSNLNSTLVFSLILVRFSIIIDHGDHPASYKMSTGAFMGVNQPRRGTDHPPPSSAKVKECRVIPPLPLWVFVACCSMHFTFFTFSVIVLLETRNRLKNVILQYC